MNSNDFDQYLNSDLLSWLDASAYFSLFYNRPHRYLQTTLGLTTHGAQEPSEQIWCQNTYIQYYS